MSASEKDRELAIYAGNWLHDESCEATISAEFDGPTMTRYLRSGEPCGCQVRHAEKFFATARAEGHRAGMERAAESMARLCYCGADDGRDCMACQCAAVIRAAANEERSGASTAGEGKSHE